MLEINRIYNQDCLEGMKEIDSQSIDLIVTDPPYNIGYESCHRDIKFNNTWDVNFKFVEYYNQMWRTLKPDSCMFVFSRFDVLCEYIRMELPIPHSVLIWDKMDYGMGDLKWFSQSYEIVIVWMKGNMKLHISGKRPNAMLRFRKVQSFGCRENKITGGKDQDFMLHPTQKPVDCVEYIIKHSTKKGDLILDPFMGSGTTAVACKQTGRNFIGFEIDKKYCEIANERLMKQPERLEKWIN